MALGIETELPGAYSATLDEPISYSSIRDPVSQLRAAGERRVMLYSFGVMTSHKMSNTNSTHWDGGMDGWMDGRRERGDSGKIQGTGGGGPIYVGYDQDTVYKCIKLAKNKLNKKLRVIEEDM